MKKMTWLFVLMLALAPIMAHADEPVISIPSGLDIHQGFIIPWENPSDGFMNMSTVTLAKTEYWASLGRWNALWDGWSIDAAWSYDANTSKGGLMLGRHFGTLGKYLPIEYPLADKIDITLYPVGILADNLDGKIDVSGASGAGIVKLSVAF